MNYKLILYLSWDSILTPLSHPDMAPPKLRVALAGLGRIGKKHAINLLNFTPPAELVAVFTPAAAELEWGRENLEPHGVALYDDYEQMLSHEGVQAVVVATAAVVHAEEVILAIDHNLHVMCEKPLSTTIESVRFQGHVFPEGLELTGASCSAETSSNPRGKSPG